MSVDTQARAAVAQCIRRCSRAKDGRGLWQAERSLQLQLCRTGSQAVAVATSGACRRLGQWLAAWTGAGA
jgi:hypothetical protein